MINKDRIVPVTKSDLLSLYGTMLVLSGKNVTVADAKTVNGAFELEETGEFILSQPAKRVDMNGDIQATFYFIPDYDFEGIYSNGSKITEPDAFETDYVNLYYFDGSSIGCVTPPTYNYAVDGEDGEQPETGA